MFSEYIGYAEDFWYEHADPRSKDFLFLRTPVPILVVIAVYVVICKIVLPLIFNGKKHPWARYLLILHYLIQLGNCIAVIIISPYYFWLVKFNFRCEPSVPPTHEPYYFFVNLCYLWLLIKILEIIESFFVYLLYGVIPNFIFIHHILLPLFLTITMHFYAGGSPLIYGFIHSFDHGFNYIFIALRMYSDEYRQKSDSWFKKYQVLSSVLSMIASLVFYLQLEKREDCNYEHFKYIVSFILFIFFSLTIHYRASNMLKIKRPKFAEKVDYKIAGHRFDPT
ncbi:hypothetical protein PVAND_012384 [Polypedilum vanderplanki]|uniref:Very-long-chain 3-oxoacyl-CoA synthase n=1 Tax=Polypedilum vanderplanki TaxID=319348 RepID=A0A9J6CMJ4_POLVA|nr:hypothetical protein PVAND_012384 [Polypedilum vanderplanki]